MIYKNEILKLIATWFYSGLSPKAPGTMGSLATLPFIYAIAALAGVTGVAVFAAAVCVIGLWAADSYAKLINQKDPGCIVIDETAGQAITLLAAGTNLWLYLLGFALFRLFDITKPGPIGWADRNLKGGLGIMADDVIAGVFGGVILLIVKYFI